MKLIKAILRALHQRLAVEGGAAGEHRGVLVPIRIGGDLLVFVPREAGCEDVLVSQLKGLGHW